MDIFFQDPTEIPLPPEEMRIRELRAQPWPDGQRVRIYLEVDPFQRRPSADLVIYDATGQEVTNASIVETMTRKMEITMHLRRPPQGEQYSLRVSLYFVSQPAEGEEPDPRQQIVIDAREITFRAQPLESAGL
jgi:hypothetical protein